MKHGSSVNQLGHPIPWYTYPLIEYLSNLDFSDKKIFEYGSGNSSIWWAGRCKTLTSVETDNAWFEKIRSLTLDLTNFEYQLKLNRSEYVKNTKLCEADVVIIDGFFRSECANYFCQNITKGANPYFLIFDNSDWYPKTIARLNAELNWI